MNICSFHHEEIVFESRDCPFCEYKIQQDELYDNLQSELDSKLDDLTDERNYYISLLQEHNPELLI